MSTKWHHPPVRLPGHRLTPVFEILAYKQNRNRHQQAHVNLTVYNMLGQRVATLVNEIRSPGWHDVTFDASGLSSGTFIYRIQAERCCTHGLIMRMCVKTLPWVFHNI